MTDNTLYLYFFGVSLLPSTKRKVLTKPNEFKWTSQKRKVAELLSTGLYSQTKAAEAVNLRRETINGWCQHPLFKAEVDRLTFLQESATRAGIVRRLLMGMDIKEGNIETDRSTYLDYIELILKVIPEETKKDDDKLRELADAIMNSAKMIGK